CDREGAAPWPVAMPAGDPGQAGKIRLVASRVGMVEERSAVRGRGVRMIRIVRLVAIVALLMCAPCARAGVAYFGDINANIEVGGQTVIDMASTYEVVFLLTSAVGSGVILEEIEPSGEDKLFQIVPNSDIRGFDFPVNNPNVLIGVAPVTLDTWHHAAYVYDGAEERLYFDGTLVGSRPASGMVSNSDGGILYVGANPIHGYTTFVGLVDSLRVSNVARYTAAFTPPTGDLSSDA